MGERRMEEENWRSGNSFQITDTFILLRHLTSVLQAFTSYASTSEQTRFSTNRMPLLSSSID